MVWNWKMVTNTLKRQCRFYTHPIFDSLRFLLWLRCLSVYLCVCVYTRLYVCVWVCRVLYPVHIALCVYLSHFFYFNSAHKPPVLAIRKLFERAGECWIVYCISVGKIGYTHTWYWDTVFNACLSFCFAAANISTTTQYKWCAVRFVSRLTYSSIYMCV